MVDLAHAPAPSAAAAEFRTAVTRLATILFPAAAGAWLLGSTTLPLLFTNTYLAAVPLFLLATVEIPLWVLPVDALLRAQGETRYLLWFSAVRIAVAALLILSGIHFFGLAGALLGSILTEALSRVCMLKRGCRALGVGPGRVFDWPGLARIVVSAALAAAAAWPVRLVLAGGPMVVASVAVYGIAYVLSRYLLEPRDRARPEPSTAGRAAAAA
jgi:O-antigen/teichoic acid export membrane protein